MIEPFFASAVYSLPGGVAAPRKLYLVSFIDSCVTPKLWKSAVLILLAGDV